MALARCDAFLDLDDPVLLNIPTWLGSRLRILVSPEKIKFENRR
jgi:hypothetical protein